MSQPNVEVLDSDLLKEADETARLNAIVPGDELRTVPVSTIAGPPFKNHPAPTPAILPPPAPLPSFSDVPLPTKPSWLGALLTSAFHPTGRPSAPREPEHAVAAMLGWGSLLLGVVFALVALITGARAAVSPEASLAPAIGVAGIAARTVFALGCGALSYAFFRITERLLMGRRT
jgi:hypothetical protein